MGREFSALLAKELRQLPRKRGAVITAVVFPLLFFIVLPALNLATTAAGPAASLPIGVGLPPGLAGLDDEPTAMVRRLTMPLFVAIGGLMLPSVMAIYTIVAEREKRTLELLVALPVSVSSIVTAKLGAVVGLAAAIILPLFAVDAVALLALGLASPGDVLGLLWLLLSALAYSTASALVTALLCGDYRTANNLSGLLFGPLILVTMGTLILLPGGVGPLVLGALFTALAALMVFLALRRLTFERLIG